MGAFAMPYGELHRVSDFIKRIVGARSTSDNGFILEVIAFLQALDRIQDKNPSVTLAIHTGDGVWVYYKGEKLLFIKPTKQFLNLHVFEPIGSTDAKRQLVKFIRSKRKSGFGDPSAGTSWLSWRISGNALESVISFIARLPAAKRPKKLASNHARSIPGNVRQEVLQDFLRRGSMCLGVSGKTRPHKLKDGDTIEIDHILPYAKRGASSFENVQVLCQSCNRLKGATAL